MVTHTKGGCYQRDKDFLRLPFSQMVIGATIFGASLPTRNAQRLRELIPRNGTAKIVIDAVWSRPMTRLSKYRISERPDGFTVEAPDRVPARVTLTDTGFQVEADRPRQLRLFPELAFDDEPGLPNCTLIQYRRRVGLACGC